ncbi:glycosyltransferase [Sodalis sp. RH15]|uniref:glycosyltransferase n=1 Tax=Sodalis sp. RH15 TaxID=3394330 RepID=UPI0039B49E5E
MRIGLSRCKYPEVRCIVNKESINDTYINFEKLNLSYYINKFKSFFFKKNVTHYFFKPFFFESKHIDIFHFVNDITDAKVRWVSTFETMIPRTDALLNEHRKANGEISYKYESSIETFVELMASNFCLKIIALSSNSYNIQCAFLKAYPKYFESIISKMEILQPPQKLLVNYISEKKLPLNKIRFIFIGRDFYRKGGAEIVYAFDSLIKAKSLDQEKIELILVGDLSRTNNYVFNANQLEEEELLGISSMINNTDYIKHYNFLDNEKIINLIKCSHVGLLPTWGDTFGYSVLEMQAAGCPVITTDVRALQEINNNNVGWLISTKKNIFNEIVIQNADELLVYKHSIIRQLKKIILEIYHEPFIINEKATASIERIRKDHNPKKYFEKLQTFYMS